MNEAQISFADGLAAALPTCGDAPEGMPDYISLCDIVATGVEHHEFTHFTVSEYDPDADGVNKPWGVLIPLGSAGPRDDGYEYQPRVLWADSVRRAVSAYVADRLSRGMDTLDVTALVDGSYTDVIVADSVLQFLLYGKEIYA
jgi:hypothetical protein